MGQPLDVLERARSTMTELAAVPVACLAGDELVAWHEGVQQLRSMADALSCTGLAASDPASLPGLVGGPRTVCTRVAAASGVSPRTLRGEQAVGQWLVDHPVFERAFAAGEISLAHVRALRRADNPRTRPNLAEAQEILCEAARSLPWGEFLRAVRYWELCADPDGEEPRDQLAGRACSYRTNADGTVAGHLRLDPVAGAAFTSAMDTIVQRLWARDHEQGSMRTATQRRADALVELLTGEGASPLIHVVLGARLAEELLTRGATQPASPEPWPTDHDDVDARCELLDGIPLHPHWAAAAMATARFRRLILGPAGEILDHGRTSRTFPRQLKQALLVRARGRCQEPGCDAPVTWLEADHLIPWNRAGPTNAANGQILCSAHNKGKGDRLPSDSDSDPDPDPGSDSGYQR